MKFMQINLHRSRGATEKAKEYLPAGKCDVVLIQEPWTKEYKVLGWDAKNLKTFYATGNGRPRTCIVTHTYDKMISIPQITNIDNVEVLWQMNENDESSIEVIVSTCHMT